MYSEYFLRQRVLDIEALQQKLLGGAMKQTFFERSLFEIHHRSRRHEIKIVDDFRIMFRGVVFRVLPEKPTQVRARETIRMLVKLYGLAVAGKAKSPEHWHVKLDDYYTRRRVGA